MIAIAFLSVCQSIGSVLFQKYITVYHKAAQQCQQDIFPCNTNPCNPKQGSIFKHIASLDALTEYAISALTEKTPSYFHEYEKIFTKQVHDYGAGLISECQNGTLSELKREFQKIVRYADDFLIGVIGSKEDAEKIKSDIGKFFKETLKLELSVEKTLITNSDDNVTVCNDSALKKARGKGTVKAYTGKIKLYLPKERWVGSC